MSNTQPAPSPSHRQPVALRITTEALLQLLRLDPTKHELVDLGVERHAGFSLAVLSLDVPDAPAGAVEMIPSYYTNGRPDPVSLTHIVWRDADGNESTQLLATGKFALTSVPEQRVPEQRVDEPTIKEG